MPESLLPGARPLAEVPPEDVEGWVAVNATTLTVHAHEELAWLRAYCPVDHLDGTVLLYRFTTPPRAIPGPEAPPPTCEAGPSRRVQ